MAAMAVAMPVASSVAAVGTSACRHSTAGTSSSSSSSAAVATLSSLGAPVRGGSAASVFMRGQILQRRLAVSPSQRQRRVVVKAQAAEVETEADTERLRLNNLSPQPGSRHRQKRKGRGIAAGQGASCGFGMRGQKSRSGSGVRPGFEGGQMPLYRRLPKLKGIAGGMGAGLPNFVTINLSDIAAANFSEGEEVSLESLISRRILNPSGRDSKLRLKVLGDGELTTKLTVKAGAFSKSAKEKLEVSGSTLVDVPGRKKWVRPSVLAHQERALKYYAEKKAAGNWIEK